MQVVSQESAPKGVLIECPDPPMVVEVAMWIKCKVMQRDKEVTLEPSVRAENKICKPSSTVEGSPTAVGE
jgi:hypothetical protein